jgi:3-oxoacyl-[acyl-carrier protein] reductase
MNVLITGASRGIGKELALYFTRKGAKHLFLLSRDIKKLEVLQKQCFRLNPKCKIHLLPFSLDKEENFSKIADEIKKSCKHLDILINNAGHLVNKSFSEITLEELHSCYEVNVFGPFRLIQCLLPFMGGKTSTHIINIGSMGGVQGSAKFAGLSAYSSSKMAIAGLSECLAEEFKEKNISVNCLAIGAVNTEMLRDAFPGYNAPIDPKEMASFIGDFSLNGNKYFNGKILPVAVSTP